MGKWKEIKILEELSQIHNLNGLQQFLKLHADLVKNWLCPWLSFLHWHFSG